MSLLNRLLLLTVCVLTLLIGTAAPERLSASAAVCGDGDHGLQLKRAGSAETPVFTDIQFLNASTGRAAGNGFLIGTSNAGCNWQTIYSGQWRFQQIVFPSNVTGYALAAVEDGSVPYLIRTTDGGSHWKRLDTGINGIRRIAFIDSVNGFLYTQAFAYGTSDGGKSWKRIPTPVNTRGVSFRSASTGWAVVVKPGAGYAIMRTNDGGRHWSTTLRVPSVEQLGGDVYSNADQVWVLLYGGSGMSQTSYTLLAGGTKGTTWTPVISQSTAGGGPAPGTGSNAAAKEGPASPGGRPGNLSLVGMNAAYLAAGSGGAGKAGAGRSLDGGRHWVNLPTLLAGSSAHISFPDRKTGWLAITSADHPGIYKTSDGGLTWSRVFSVRTEIAE